MRSIPALSCMILSMGPIAAADFPSANISNGQIRARVYLPEVKRGFYQGTRFDWSGILYSLEFQGHDYYGPWFQKTSPSVHDFIYEGSDVVAGPCSAITGPVDEFGPLGWDQAKPGATFIKIGIGALRRPDAEKYDHYKLYEIADPGKWTVRPGDTSVEFIQELADASSGYGYVYRKAIRLTKGKPEMLLEHSLKNTGQRAIRTDVYNHNFFVLDHQPLGPGVVITVPYQIKSSHPPDKELAEIRGNQIVYVKTLEGRDVFETPLEGFGATAKDHQIRIDSSRAGAGMHIECNRPLSHASIWSIRTVVAVEPFVSIAIEPGAEFTWKSVYEYYTLPPEKK